MKKLKSLSIFFPALNDSLSLPSLIEKSNKTARDISDKFEIIIIDDGSKDNTSNVIDELKNKYLGLRVIKHKKNLGYGAALISGFKSSKYEWVFYTDGDGQYDPCELIKLVKNLDNKTDVVNGYKLNRDDSNFRKFIGKFYNFLIKKLYRIPISDIDCDFRLIKKIFLDRIDLKSTSGMICLELIVKLNKVGANFKEVGVCHYKRRFGKSQFFTFKNVLTTLKDNLLFFLSFNFHLIINNQKRIAKTIL